MATVDRADMPAGTGHGASRLKRLLGTSTFRIAALITAAFVLAAAAVVAALFSQATGLLTAQTLASLEQDRARYVSLYSSGGAAAVEREAPQMSRLPQAGEPLVLLVDAGGHRLAGNINTWPPRLADRPAGGAFERDGAPAVGLVTTFAGGVRLLVGRDVQDQTAQIARMRRTFLAGFGLLSLVGLVGGLVAARLMLSRVGAMSDTAAEIMAGDLSRRIALTDGDDELDQLALHLNAMLDRIEQLMAAMREVSDNIAHDLRTPLSRLRSRAEAALREPVAGGECRSGLARVIEDADEIIKTFNALLLVARLEAGTVDGGAEPFELDRLIRDVAELYEPAAEEAGQALVVGDLPACRIVANRQLVGQAMANLVDNAIKYGRAASGAGRIEIGLKIVTDQALVWVGDNGPGIPAADRERVARRFVRLDRSRSQPGTGLGLSLVAAVARMHGGSMLIEDNTPGVRIVLALPLSVGEGGQ